MAEGGATREKRVPAVKGVEDQARAYSVVEGIEPWSFESLTGKVIQTAHYRIYTTEKEAIIVDRAPRFLEIALAHYRSAVGALPEPPQRLETFLMDNRPQWSRLTLRMLGEQGKPLMNIGRGGFATGGRAYLYDIGVFDTLAIAAHEGWHQYTQRTFRRPLPVWLEEGLATYMEGHKWESLTPRFLPWANVERYDHLRTAVSKRELIPLQALLSMTPQTLLAQPGDPALTYYAEVWALVHWLWSDGARAGALERALQAAARGEADPPGQLDGRLSWGEAYFRSWFGDPAALGDEFARYLDAVAAVGARGAIVQGEAPAGLAR